MVTIADAYALSFGTMPNTVYPGYEPASTITLTAMATGVTNNYSYEWSTGVSTVSITVAPTVTTTYTVMLKDAYGCTASASKTVIVVDVNAGNKGKQVYVCHKGMTLKVGASAVAAHLAHGDMLGNCAGDFVYARKINPAINTEEEVVAKAWPNPAAAQFSVMIAGFDGREKISLKITDQQGRMIEQLQNLANSQTIEVGANYKAGVYFAEIVQGTTKKTLRLVKL